MCPRVLNPLRSFPLEHILVPSSILHRSGTRHIENSSDSFKTNSFYSKKHYKTILQKCQNVVVNVCSSHRRRRLQVPSGRALVFPCCKRLQGRRMEPFFFFNLYKFPFIHKFKSHSVVIRCSSGSHQSEGQHDPPASQSGGIVFQGLRWLDGALGAGQRPPLLFLQLAHRDEAAAFGGVRSGGAAVFQDAESLV